MTAVNLLARFEAKYIPEPNSGCWLWLGAWNDKGYGQFYFPPRNMVSAHTASWIIHRGDRKGLSVLHSCDMRCCRQRRAPPKGAINGMAKLTEIQVLAIRSDARRPRFIAADYKIPVSTIKKIKARTTWKHLP